MPAPNGTGASRSAQLRITVPGNRSLSSSGPFRIAGRLLDSNSLPIVGATLTVETRPHFPKSGTSPGEWQTLGDVVTDAKGVYRGRVPEGASRSIRVTYLAAPGDGSPSATAVTDVVIPAQVTARTVRARVRNGKSAVFRGRVAGPIPDGGVLVALEAREPGRWVPVATTRRWVRTTASGTFTLRYRFRRTFSPTLYRFRVVVGEDSAFQYSRGASRTLSVRVRP
jgi:hypothetical protein